MAEASLLHVAESLLVKLAPYAFKEIKSWWGAKDDLQRLVSSIRIIKAGLLDAEKRQEGRDREGQLVKEWLRCLRNVLYDADDLFDEVITAEESRKTLTGREKFSREISQFFSKSNRALFLVDIAGRIKKIRKELDGIKSDMGHFTFEYRLSEEVVCFERETGSVKAADDVIGREEEEKELMGFLLDDTSKEKGLADVIAIVGFGGLGKTTLAQLLYNNAVVKEKFELCLWACISDIKGTTSKARIILDALQTTGEKVGSSEWSLGARNVHEISVNELEVTIHGRLQNNKYLLVLDDFWDEDPQTWLYLKGLLRGGKTGSKILLTTRSSKVAAAMGVETLLDLKGLDDDKAWELFKRLAFRSAADAENESLIMMGKEIVKKCKNVPLAIKAIASLVYTFHDNVREWKSVMDSDMLTLERTYQNLNIIPVLKLGCDHLPSHLKHCFAFCSLYPKGHKMNGARLVHHWIAQGYIEHCYERGQFGLEEIGRNYLTQLVSRSFLPIGLLGECYMHDLMHDLAQEMAGEEVFFANKSNCKIKERNQISKEVRIRHLSFCGVQNVDGILSWTTPKFLRSLVHAYHHFEPHSVDCTISEALVKKLILRFRLLRSLDLSSMGLECLPSTIGELKHLRCLIISRNRFRHLPNTITKLQNLKILDISWCIELEALPADFRRLKKLSCLMMRSCISLSSMPCRIEDLPSLESLDRFAVRNSLSELEASARLVNHSSILSVQYLNGSGGCMSKEEEEEEKGVDLSSSPLHLDALEFSWPNAVIGWESSSEFECSQLPSNLKRLYIAYYPGQKLPEWKKSFNCLLIVSIYNSKQCKYLPSFGQHPQLRRLYLAHMDELEYIQMEMEGDGDQFPSKTHFPCLEYLFLWGLCKLKAWSPGMEKLGLRHICSSAAAPFPRFHSLAHLKIGQCPELMSLPLPPEGNVVKIYSDVLKEPLSTLLGVNQQTAWPTPSAYFPKIGHQNP